MLSLKPFKAPGPENLNPKMLKETAAQICIPLSVIFSRSLKEGQLPSDWKVANTVLIHKKSDKSVPSNYRPVSLTSVNSKLFEGIIHDSMMDHLYENKLITEYQHGFVPKKSCMTQLLQAMEDWAEVLDSGNSIDVLYLDFKKAVDSVPHERLLRKTICIWC